MTAQAAMQALLLGLVEALLPLQGGQKTGHNQGGLWCPYHGEFHVRCGEAAFPMVFLGMQPGRRALFDHGLALCDWMVRMQNANGSWYEDQDQWDGTSVFQLLALAALLDTAGPRIDPERKTVYCQALTRAAEWVCENIRLRRVVINYVAGAAAALALSHRVRPQAKWQKKARSLAFLATRRINREGFVVGEGAGRRLLKKIYFEPKGIDIGYGLEMTLAALALYIQLSGEKRLIPDFDRALATHLDFIYPDGSLDNSLGSRGYKWTIYGSKTSHGSQMALAFGSPRNPAAGQALVKSLEHLGTCLQDNHLADGPFHETGQGVSCLYPTAIKAVNLACTLAYMPGVDHRPVPWPDDEDKQVKAFASLNSLRIKQRSWSATISGYGHMTPLSGHGCDRQYFFVPGGGSVTYLYHAAWGPVQAATQLAYRPMETLHMPALDPRPESLTPRVVLQTDQGTATSAHFRKARIQWQAHSDAILVEVEGDLVLPIGKGQPLQTALQIRYIWQGDSFTKYYALNLRGACRMLAIMEPVLWPLNAGYAEEAAGLRLLKDDRCLLVQMAGDSGPFGLQPLKPCVFPLPSLRALPLCFCRKEPGAGRQVLQVSFQVKNSANKHPKETPPCPACT